MNEKNNISVVIAIHEFTDETKKLFGIAIQSIADQFVRPDAVVLVTPKNSTASEYLKSYDFGDLKSSVKLVENDGKTDFCSQINYGVSQVDTEWFSILEYDDEYSKIWFRNVVKYRDAYPDVGIFMPIIVDADSNGSFIGTTNEAVWAHQFSDELGFLDNGSLLTYQNFNTDGVVMKKSLFEDFGGFKPSIKLTFIYEFLLRMTFNSVRTMVIPRYGYKHINQRIGSLFNNYRNELDPVESKWWLAQAKKEHYFPSDRGIQYKEGVS